MSDMSPAERRGGAFRRMGAAIRASGAGTSDWLAGRGLLVRASLFLGGLLLVAAALWYPVGATWVHRINDDPDFAVSTRHEVPGGSRAVAMMASLITREVDETRWVANDPWFLPGAVLDNMPAFQTGILYGLSRVSVSLADHLGRARGTSQIDPDLDAALGRMKYPGDVWYWQPSVGLMPQSPSEEQYRSAAAALDRYNRRLAEGQAVFDRRGDNLLAVLESMASDLGSSSAVLDGAIDDPGGLFDTDADDIFYAVKGRLYAYAMVLRELGVDFETVIVERGAQTVWANMLDSFRTAVTIDPWVVSNAALDEVSVANHLAAQGFYVMRARNQLFEMVNILLK